MRRGSVRLVGVAAGIVALVVAVAIPAGSARGMGGGGCAQRTTGETVFPAAKAVGFQRRGPTAFESPRAPFWPGRCIGWWVEYEHLGRTGRVKSYVDVTITLYRTHEQALAALTEPLAVPTLTLADGARARVARDHAWVLSVYGNMLIGCTSSFLPTDKKGIPDFKGGPDVSLEVLMRMQRTIHANIRRLP